MYIKNTLNYLCVICEEKIYEKVFVREPKEQSYGTVAVFKDLYGNLLDLVQFKENHPIAQRVK